MIKNLFNSYFLYFLAEKYEKRDILSKLKELKTYYKQDFKEREDIVKKNLINMLYFASDKVPYYKDLFNNINFSVENIQKDIKYFQDIPYLTKDIINEQGDRLFSTSLDQINHHLRKTGGSTGPSSHLYYDHESLDYSAAIMLFCRDFVGKKRHYSELHFATKFPGHQDYKIFSKDWFKNFILNRYNIFFNSFDDKGLNEIWKQIQTQKPHLVHGHPSTMYALACYLESLENSISNFKVFEPSGELLQPYMEEKIKNVFNCKIVNRYGLAEFGVIAYDLNQKGLQILDSEGYPEYLETDIGNEFVFTGFRNRLMPLIRYRTGDLAKVEKRDDGYYMTEVMGRVHDIVNLGDKKYPTHHIMDIMDHFVGGTKEFQIDMRDDKPILRIVPIDIIHAPTIEHKVREYFGDSFLIEFIEMEQLIKVGRHSKFRHVVK